MDGSQNTGSNQASELEVLWPGIVDSLPPNQRVWLASSKPLMLAESTAVVAVPNGLLSAMSLENFSLRDRILFQHTIALGRQTTAEQMRLVLEQIRGLLDRHPQVDSTTSRVRFIRFSSGSLDLELFAYVLERDFPAFLAIQERLLLGVMDILEAAGTSVAPLMIPMETAPLARK